MIRPIWIFTVIFHLVLGAVPSYAGTSDASGESDTFSGGIQDFDKYCGTGLNKDGKQASQGKMFDNDNKAIGDEEYTLKGLEGAKNRELNGTDYNNFNGHINDLSDQTAVDENGNVIENQGDSELEKALDPKNTMASTSGSLEIPPCFLFYMNLIGLTLNILHMFLSYWIGSDSGCLIPGYIGFVAFWHDFLAFFAELFAFFIVRDQIKKKKDNLVATFKFFKCLRYSEKVELGNDKFELLKNVSIIGTNDADAQQSKIDTIDKERLLACVNGDMDKHTIEREYVNKDTGEKFTTQETPDHDLSKELDGKITTGRKITEAELDDMLNSNLINLDLSLCSYYSTLIDIYKLQRDLAIQYVFPMYTGTAIATVAQLIMLYRIMFDRGNTLACGAKNPASLAGAKKNRALCSLILKTASGLLHIFTNHDYDYDRGASAASDKLYTGDILYWVNTAFLRFGSDIICQRKSSFTLSRSAGINSSAQMTPKIDASLNAVKMSGSTARFNTIVAMTITFNGMAIALMVPYIWYYMLMIEQYNKRIQAVEDLMTTMKCPPKESDDGSYFELKVTPPHVAHSMENVSPKDIKDLPELLKIVLGISVKPISNAVAQDPSGLYDFYRQPMCLGGKNPYKKSGRCFPTRTDYLLHELSKSPYAKPIFKKNKRLGRILKGISYEKQKKMGLEQRMNNLKYLAHLSQTSTKKAFQKSEFKEAFGAKLIKKMNGFVNYVSIDNVDSVSNYIKNIISMPTSYSESVTKLKQRQSKMGGHLPVDIKKISNFQYDEIAKKEDVGKAIISGSDNDEPKKKVDDSNYIFNSIEDDDGKSIFDIISNRYMKLIIKGEVEFRPELLK